MNDRPDLTELMQEYERAIAFTDSLWADLSEEEVRWRPVPESSAIGWHLGHQAAVAHYMVRNLTAAEPGVDASLDQLMDGATAEVDRGDLPGLDALRSYRERVADRVRFRVGNIERGEVGTPVQLRRIAEGMVSAIVNHEYQHAKWIGETRSEQFGHALPASPTSPLLTELDGYVILR